MFKSHLLQMRGLKLRPLLLILWLIWSHLLQMRGLKQLVLPIFVLEGMKSHLLQMRGLKLCNAGCDYIDVGSRIFYRCVD